jgi:Fe2+ transport system protein FeoA
MRLDQLQEGQKAKIISIDAPKSLIDRLYSFGILPQEIVECKAHSLAKQTIEIEVENTLVALRNEEAHKIEVELI